MMNLWRYKLIWYAFLSKVGATLARLGYVQWGAMLIVYVCNNAIVHLDKYPEEM